MIISELEKESIALKLTNEFDFFRRLDGRLTVQKDRLKQVRNAMLAEKIQTNKNKMRLYNTKIEEINKCISEMTFIRNNIIDDFYDKGY